MVVSTLVLLGSTDLSEEGPVKLDDVGTVAAPHHHVQIHQQLLLLLLIHRGADPLTHTHTHTHTHDLRLLFESDRSLEKNLLSVSPPLSLCLCLTLTAMICSVGLCTILLTEP